ncbi:PLP-dependent aminotransferase family protein [Mesorhizobium loti]|uniref:PLP-dependent aminotransferase family protein n=1 Tax=Mesorhizobium loti R88b TaxID=935548 RepID=A0A6M7WWJ3_RHILI|nr:PLP-dependent aminotransferase family protein [Mesorhizobium loti]QKD04454.1 PLP-dependent aminotransferase family protein [Mesorhizobium loti R88b]
MTDDWRPDISDPHRPAYLALAEAIARDLTTGRLKPGDRLPSQRTLAAALGLNFTTVSRGYREAHRRGLIEARVGSGSHVARQPDSTSVSLRRRDLSDRTMNQAPELDDPTLLRRMRAIWEETSEDLGALLRYQSPGGSAEDKAAALRWLSRRGIEATSEKIIISPGTHAVMLAILRSIARPGDTICSEDITYPGIIAICDHLGLKLVGLPSDALGLDPQALADRALAGPVRALYLNPTIRNPTTHTIVAKRRAELVEVARRFGIEILEDDAYGLFPTDAPPPLVMLAPELTYHIVGLSKCLAAGLRVAYAVMPSGKSAETIGAQLKTEIVMASPLTTTLATRWIETGVADEILQQLRLESRLRQKIAAEMLPMHTMTADPEGFHIWITPPKPWTRQRIVDWMRGHALGAVASDAFVVGRTPPEALRLCLGGAATRADMQRALAFMIDAFNNPPSFPH